MDTQNLAAAETTSKRRREQTKESETRRRTRLKRHLTTLKSILFQDGKVTRDEILEKAIQVFLYNTFSHIGNISIESTGSKFKCTTNAGEVDALRSL